MLRKLAHSALARGMTLVAQYDHEVDYRGRNLNLFLEAMNACDEMSATFVAEDGSSMGWLLYIPYLDKEEQIADYSTNTWVGSWIEEHS